MRVYVPFEPDDPKTRLSSVLDRAERERFAAAMLADVYSSVEGTEHEAVVLSTRDLRSDPSTTSTYASLRSLSRPPSTRFSNPRTHPSEW
ncbi:MAG: hypothetical protein SV760_07010 [Halobacteria archaeon]|nr:hypothetical protein [Halobacteria archaeon]